ncbi:nucleolar protein 14-like [Ptychodera flava]|uniref:nucleolar protein 14-like n=1 Tax=Ptychodera flava TaxID=63121 RepID=UPI003969C230
MGKSKKNRRGLSEKVRLTKAKQEKKMNPFEIRINKEKYSVLGRKTKHDKGVPGVSRSKAMKKRKETLLKEYLQRNKNNKVVDRRLGENDATLTPEEKMMKRFAFEKQRYHEKASIYNLNEEEELTHYGQSLAEVEKFEHPLDESDDDEAGRLDAEYVAQEHFGGFLTKKKDSEKDDKPKSKKELLEEKIAQSKKEKYDRQHEKEATAELREKLDADWKEISTLLGTSKKKKDKNISQPAKSDDYDIAVRELAFDLKAKATDRLKTPEELAKEERERLEKFEADRQRRMLGITEEEEKAAEAKTIHHRSADDLGDDFEMPNTDKFHVRYDEGKLILPEGVESLHDLAKVSKPKYTTSDDNDDDDDDDEEEEEEEDDNDVEQDDDKNEIRNSDDNIEGTSEREKDTDEVQKDDEEDSEDDKDEDDSGGDLETDEEMESGAESEQEMDVTADSKKRPEKVNKKERETMIEEAKKELPYTFPAPSTYDDLRSIIGGYDTNQQITILDRIRKCHHPSLAEGNKEKLETLFSLLVEYYGDLCCERPLKMDLIDGLIRHLYELSQQSPQKSAEVVQSVIVERYEDFDSVCEKKGSGKYPGLDSLLYFKLVSLLFPTSDFSHSVVTPTMLYMGQILTHCQPINCKDVAAGLFICNLFLQYIRLSRRYVPEALNYLRGVLFLATKKEASEIHNLTQPFKLRSKYNDILVLSPGTDTREMVPQPLSILDVFGTQTPGELQTDSFLISALSTCLQLLQQYAELYTLLPSYREIFRPIQSALVKLNVDAYPQTVKEQYHKLKEQISSQDNRQMKFLVKEKKKPTSIRFFEPKIEEDYDMDSKRKNKNKKMNESQKLVHRHRREMKGAIREIRKDSQFLARQKIQEQLERDAERKQKLRELHHMLGTQEGEFKQLQRKKGKFT